VQNMHHATSYHADTSSIYPYAHISTETNIGAKCGSCSFWPHNRPNQYPSSLQVQPACKTLACQEHPLSELAHALLTPWPALIQPEHMERGDCTQWFYPASSVLPMHRVYMWKVIPAVSLKCTDPALQIAYVYTHS